MGIPKAMCLKTQMQKQSDFRMEIVMVTETEMPTSSPKKTDSNLGIVRQKKTSIRTMKGIVTPMGTPTLMGTKKHCLQSMETQKLKQTSWG